MVQTLMENSRLSASQEGDSQGTQPGPEPPLAGPEVIVLCAGESMQHLLSEPRVSTIGLVL